MTFPTFSTEPPFEKVETHRLERLTLPAFQMEGPLHRLTLYMHVDLLFKSAIFSSDMEKLCAG